VAVPPKREASDSEQLLLAVKNARGHPGHLVAQKLPGRKGELVFYVVQVCRPVQVPALPTSPLDLDGLGQHRPLPKPYLLLVGAYIVYEGEPRWEGPNEAASFALEYREEAFDHERLHKDVIIEEEHGVGLSASQEEVALLSDTARVAMVPLDRAAAGLEMMRPNAGTTEESSALWQPWLETTT
jgi:hypothetical protein